LKKDPNYNPTNPNTHTHFFGKFSNDFVVLITHCRLPTQAKYKITHHTLHTKQHTTHTVQLNLNRADCDWDCGLCFRWINGWDEGQETRRWPEWS